jgi:hypothetical protein
MRFPIGSRQKKISKKKKSIYCPGDARPAK